MQILAEYLVPICFPCWFRIKLHNRITAGSKHFFYMLRLISNFSNAVINDIGVKVLQNNGPTKHRKGPQIDVLNTAKYDKGP